MNEFIRSRPQELCLMCGKCCKTVSAAKSNQELNDLASQGDTSALDFLSIFRPYASLEDAKNVDRSVVENILKGAPDGKELTFYHCKHILDNNCCGNYENRPQLCRNFPSSPFAVVPQGCGYEGWLFAQREKVKHKVRELKESIIEYKAELKSDLPPEQKRKIQIIIDKSQQLIDVYASYGSADW